MLVRCLFTASLLHKPLPPCQQVLQRTGRVRLAEQGWIDIGRIDGRRCFSSVEGRATASWCIKVRVTRAAQRCYLVLLSWAQPLLLLQQERCVEGVTVALKKAVFVLAFLLLRCRILEDRQTSGAVVCGGGEARFPLRGGLGWWCFKDVLAIFHHVQLSGRKLRHQWRGVCRMCVFEHQKGWRHCVLNCSAVRCVLNVWKQKYEEEGKKKKTTIVRKQWSSFHWASKKKKKHTHTSQPNASLHVLQVAFLVAIGWDANRKRHPSFLNAIVSDQKKKKKPCFTVTPLAQKRGRATTGQQAYNDTLEQRGSKPSKNKRYRKRKKKKKRESSNYDTANKRGGGEKKMPSDE